jgi:hypothetical protein
MALSTGRPTSIRTRRAIIVALASALAAVTAGPSYGQRTASADRPRWEYGQFEWVRDTPPGAEVARWTVGDSVTVSTRSVDNLAELVTRRRNPKTETQHTFFAWLGDNGWEMVSCRQIDPTNTAPTLTMSCWFKRQRP